MEITPQEIIHAVQTFPTGVQMEIVETLQKNLSRNNHSVTLSEDEIERRLLAKGLISEIPPRVQDAEEENYQPIKISGKSLSESILEERD